MKQNNKILALGILCLIFSSSLILAQGNRFIYPVGESRFRIQEMEQVQNRFQERYNFTCKDKCIQRQLEGDGEDLDRLEVREQRKFLFWDVELEDFYDINGDGELVQARHNFWSQLLNRNKVRA